MVAVPVRAAKTIETNRRYEDYKSMKQHFQYSQISEVLFNGWMISAGAVAEVLSGERAISYLGAEGIVYLKTLADLAANDGQEIYVEYQDDTGLVYGPITHLIDVAGGTGTDVEHALGNENVMDTVAAVDGTFKLITLTGLAGTLNQYAGLYMVCYSGDQKGTSHLINSNTAATPTILTLNTASAANLAADLVQIQTYPCVEFFRLRRMWTAKEAVADNAIELCNHDGSAWYGEISDENSRSANSHHFTQPESVCRSFLGKVHLNAPTVQEGDTVLTGFNFDITFTPKAIDANETPSDITLKFYFYGDFLWEPCIELAGASDVTFKIGDLITVPHNILVETAILEVYDVNKVMT